MTNYKLKTTAITIELSKTDLVFAGDLHYWIHVFWVIETVPETHQAQREKAAAASVEAMVHPNTLSFKVIWKLSLSGNSFYIVDGYFS